MGIVYHHGTLLPLFPIIGEFCWKVNGILNISEDDILKVDANLALEKQGRAYTAAYTKTRLYRLSAEPAGSINPDRSVPSLTRKWRGYRYTVVSVVV